MPSRTAVLPLLVTVAAYAALSVIALPAPLEWDERHHYLPALDRFADAWPGIPDDYRMPLPPLGLWTFGTVYHLSERSVLAVRLLSLAFAAWTGLLVWRQGCPGRSLAPRSWWFALTMTPHAMVTSAFIFKVNTLAVLLVTAALRAPREGGGESRTVGLRIGPSVALTLAVLSHQMAAAAAVLHLGLGIVEARGDRRALLQVLGVRLVPLLALVGCFLAWGGFQPPDYRSFGLEREVGRVGIRWGQLAAALIVTGAWTIGALGARRRAARLALIALGPCVVLVAGSGILAGNDWSGAFLRGPIRDALDRLCLGLSPLCVGGAALMAAIGAGLIADSLLHQGPRRVWASYAVIYVLMMNAVPYAYEQYYLLLIVPGLVLLAREPAVSTSPWLTLLRGSVVAFGLAMAVRAYL